LVSSDGKKVQKLNLGRRPTLRKIYSLLQYIWLYFVQSPIG